MPRLSACGHGTAPRPASLQRKQRCRPGRGSPSSARCPQEPWYQRGSGWSVTARPGVSRGTRNRAGPLSVCASTAISLAIGALATQSLAPLTIQVAAIAPRGGGDGALDGCGPVVVDAERGVGAGLAAGERQMVVVVVQERRQKAVALLRRHRAEQEPRQRRGFAPARRRRRRRRPPAPRSRCSRSARRRRRRPAPRAAPACAAPSARPCAAPRTGRLRSPRSSRCGVQRDRLDLVFDEIAHRVAEFELLGAEMKVVHRARLVRLDAQRLDHLLPGVGFLLDLPRERLGVSR